MITLLILVLLFILLLRSRDFFHNNIPLGYDPGLYKEMFIRYYELWNNRNFSILPKWIQSMYEPGLGMIWATFQHLVLPFQDVRLTWWWLAISALLPLATYMLAKKINKETWILAALLVWLSFIQYAVFRRAYWKQTLGISLVLITLSLRSERKIRISLPLLILLGITNRASLLRIILIDIIWWIYILITKKNYIDKKKTLYALWWVWIMGWISIIYILRPFIQDQIISIIKPFISSISIPDYNDSYQSGGTFLATREYIKTAWYSIITGIIWLGLVIKKIRNHSKTKDSITDESHTTMRLWSCATIIMLIRVFGQWFFFQRMIGYLDVMMCICSAYALLQLKWSWRWWIIWLFLIINSITTFYRRRIIHPPLINTEEFVSIREFGKSTTKDDIIISPWFRYSPWIQWWTSWEVLAPWLFDIGRRWDASQWRESRWYNKSPETKCANIQSDYPELSGKDIYLRIGSKQWQENFSGACFTLMTWNDDLNYHRYKVYIDNR
jgi:hypothetical protein